MFAFLKQIMAERRAFVEFEPVSPESANSMNISKKFLHILELSFEAKSLIYDTKLSKPGMQSKKKKKLGTIEERVDVLYHNVIDVLTDTNFDDIIALATAYHNIGLGNAALTNRDNLEGAVRSFSRTLLLLEGKMLNRKAILISISALNELNLACGKLEQQDTPKLLDIALDLYVKYVTRSNSNWYPDPINLASVIGIKEEESNPRIMLHNLHYTTLQDHALDYLANPKNKHAFVKYLHTTLNIRLTDMISNGTQFDEKYVNWALMLFELSRYFLANGRFSEAKNHIALADYVIYKFFEDRLSKIEERERERFNDLHESYDYVCAMSNKFWGSYGVSLLRYWMKKFSHNKENKSDEIEDVLSLLNIESEKPDLIFSDLEQTLTLRLTQK
ncbi:PREDICTED: uncharacterized protein LOC105562463 isoform X2 [Vollenhovia emeryi]|uniref:uncharacterized protein LOC105562463 isoform X2 n=1 Tax=Vollenhovia emeryi TaxID=411798 RepID=UPI0005F3F977|nr:PREDICTED: uncharacterized protein LOC105562463 isoform X2 [Vollenhovia emeryi]